MDKRLLTFRLGEEVEVFQVGQQDGKSSEFQVISIISMDEDDEAEILIDLRLGIDPLASALMNFDGENIHHYEKTVNALGVLLGPRQ